MTAYEKCTPNLNSYTVSLYSSLSVFVVALLLLLLFHGTYVSLQVSTGNVMYRQNRKLLETRFMQRLSKKNEIEMFASQKTQHKCAVSKIYGKLKSCRKKRKQHTHKLIERQQSDNISKHLNVTKPLQHFSPILDQFRTCMIHIRMAYFLLIQ